MSLGALPGATVLEPGTGEAWTTTRRGDVGGPTAWDVAPPAPRAAKKACRNRRFFTWDPPYLGESLRAHKLMG